jgi:phosphate transport system protein
MKSFLETEIAELKNNLARMALLVEEQCQKIILSLETGNIEICNGLKAKDLEIDAFDILMQTQCENILAIHHPVASDLRLVMSALMINVQLERCGDIAVKISSRLKKIIKYPGLINESKLMEMSRHCFGMLKNSIDSFILENDILANQVILEDDLIDKMNYDCFEWLTVKMQSDPSLIEPCSNLLILARHLERFADHTTNIAEDVLFKIEARIASHRNNLINKNDDDEENLN